MAQVDLVSELTQTPRIKLLLDHMRVLGIDVRVCRRLAEARNQRVLLLPKRKFSRWQEAVKPPPGVAETIALYLHKPGADSRIASNRHFDISNWPGRSSDEALQQIAALVAAPLPDPAQASSADPARRRANWTNAAVLLLFMAAGGLLLRTLDFDKQQHQNTDTQTAAEPAQPSGAAMPAAAKPAATAGGADSGPRPGSGPGANSRRSNPAGSRESNPASNHERDSQPGIAEADSSASTQPIGISTSADSAALVSAGEIACDPAQHVFCQVISRDHGEPYAYCEAAATSTTGAIPQAADSTARTTTPGQSAPVTES